MEAFSLIGKVVSHYQIVEKLGAGGMGVVYKARDLHLDRFVAIKVLPPGKVSDPDRNRRFVQEAKAASALNHPSIITVHDIASEAGQDFIVMEYIEGKALDQLIGRKGLKITEALGYAVQIADGLAKAHAAGIVHRDLKPSNIMVRDDGVVKILDFGLAKLTDTLSADEFASTQTAGGAEKPHTEEGTIVGTVAYMSPEQAEGSKVDARSDIFSFGSVLYEMLTGRQAFRRDSKLATMTAIKSEDPTPASEIVAALPPQVEEALARCLRKNPQRRWQSASDLKVVLQDLKEESDSGKLRVATSIPARKRTRGWLIAVAGVLLAMTAIAIWLVVYRQKPAAGIEITRLTYDLGLTAYCAISPDGRFVAYASARGGSGNNDIYVQQIPGGTPVQLTNNPANDNDPSFSPDGLQIVFYSERGGGGLYVMNTLGGEIQGGEARRISDRGYCSRFSPDGAYISYVVTPASTGAPQGKMFLISPKGGTPKPFQPEFSASATPGSGSGAVWSPDGKHVLFCGMRDRDAETIDWWVAPVEGGSAIRTNAKRSLSLSLLPTWDVPCVWSGDFIYYLSGTTVEGINIFRARISTESFQITGKSEPVTTGTEMKISPSVARDGRMVFSAINFYMNVWGLNANTDQGTASGEPQKLTEDLTAKFRPVISRNGSKLAFVSFGGVHSSRTEIRVRDMASRREKVVLSRETPGLTRLSAYPVLSADGSVLAYNRILEGYGSYIVGEGEDSASAREICANCLIWDFFADGSSALIESLPGLVVRQNLSTGSRTPLLEHSASQLSSASLSYDDRWLAFALGKPDGKIAIYVAPVRNQLVPEKDWTLIYQDEHYLAYPKWSPNGKLLYYLSAKDGKCAIWAQRLDPVTRKPFGAASMVFRPSGTSQDLNAPRGNGTLGIAPDRLIFYMSEGSGSIYMATPKPR